LTQRANSQFLEKIKDRLPAEIKVMEDNKNIGSLEEDLLWEVEVNASVSELTNRLIMPNDIGDISCYIIEQLSYATNSKHCFAGYLNSDSNDMHYAIQVVDEDGRIHVYKKNLAVNGHRGDLGYILKNCRSSVVKKAKEKNSSLMSLLAPHEVQRYILVPATAGKKLVGQIGVANSSQDYTERELMFVKRLAVIYALAIQRFWLDQKIDNMNKALEIRVENRTKELSETNKKLKSEIEIRKLVERQLKEAKIKADAANKAKSMFVANMSHELRTPLNHIIGFTELILDKDAGDLNETQEEYLRDVHQSSKHLLSLINDILDLAKVEAGKLEFKPSQFNIGELLENSLTVIKEKAFKHKIKLAINLDSLPNSIGGDERSLKQVMYNLLSNAAKFTPDNGSIKIMAQVLESDQETNPTYAGADGRYLKVSVTDTGIGISPENLNRVFHPFEQIQSSLDRKYPGTGLGLSLTKKLIDMHNGKIWVESEGEGRGSTFHFIIPA
jgi:signal transduction histidine kinase